MKDVTAVTYQITAITSENITIINVYRSSNANNQNVIRSLNSIIETEYKFIIVCGDFNFCHRDETHNDIYTYLLNQDFNPSIQPPQPTHREGRCLDMIWTRNMQNLNPLSYINFVYYTDHGQVYLTF